MKKKIMMLAVSLIAGTCMAGAQTAQPAPPASQPQTARPSSAPHPAPLQLNSIAPPAKIQFPPLDPKAFTANYPTTQDVNAFLKSMWGYDTNRVWQVSGIQTTKAPGVSKVTILVAEQGVSHGPAPTAFFVMPDHQHAIAGTEVIPFGAHPFADNRRMLEQRANGPYKGAASKSLMLVEFADLECPHCKEAAGTMDHLATDFPNARIVFENFPLTGVHPNAEKAAEYGVCVAKLKGNAAFFQYVQAVFANQATLGTKPTETLNDAATKAGASAAEVSACAATPATRAAVANSVKLGEDLGVDQTPLLFIGGRPWPVSAMPYNLLKKVVAYEVSENAPAAK